MLAVAAVLPVALAAPGCSSAETGTEASSPNSTTSASNSSGGTAGNTASGTQAATTTGGSSTTEIPPWELDPCGVTEEGIEIKKGAACSPTDTQLCGRTCGPDSVGDKAETCVSGFYAEGNCEFDPANDYGCFAIPDQLDASCPTEGPPQATMACDVAICTPCNVGGIYLDSGGAMKAGYCVCREPNSDGERAWTCATVESWPCPSSNGC